MPASPQSGLKAVKNVSLHVARILANPDDVVKKDAKHYIANSKAPMQSLAELDRRSKCAVMRSMSSVFKPAPTGTKNDELALKRKGAAGSMTRNSCSGNLIAHEPQIEPLRRNWVSKNHGELVDKP